MKRWNSCYNCGHPAHGVQDCIECDCPNWRDFLDEKLRERPKKVPPKQYDEST